MEPDIFKNGLFAPNRWQLIFDYFVASGSPITVLAAILENT